MLRCVAAVAVVAAAAAVRAVGRWSLSAGVRAGPPVSHPARHASAPGWGEAEAVNNESDLANGEHSSLQASPKESHGYIDSHPEL